MGSLLDAIRAATVRKGPPCAVGVLLMQLSPEMAKDLNEALSEPGVKATTIVKILGDLGHRVDVHALRRHRKAECLCPR